MNYTIENPVGLDFEIQKIQNHLFENLNWGDIDIYGRVYKNPIEKKGLTLEAYIGNNEYKDVLTDDTKTANIFFIEDPIHNTKEGILFNNKVKIVFMVNLNKVYPNIRHRADSEVKIEIIELIKSLNIITIEKIEKGVKLVLSEFDIKLNDMQPFHTFSISGNMSYYISNINCFN